MCSPPSACSAATALPQERWSPLTAPSCAWASVPSNTTSATSCGDFAHTFWNRLATQPEIDTCVNVAMVDTVKETDPHRRWAYACASVLSSAGFMTY